MGNGLTTMPQYVGCFVQSWILVFYVPTPIEDVINRSYPLFLIFFYSPIGANSGPFPPQPQRKTIVNETEARNEYFINLSSLNLMFHHECKLCIDWLSTDRLIITTANVQMKG